MENLVIDVSGEIRIPQNKNSFFLIEADKKWKYTVKISFKAVQAVDFLNLYLILQSYALSRRFPVISIASFFFDKNSNLAISKKESVDYFKKINFMEFET